MHENEKYTYRLPVAKKLMQPNNKVLLVFRHGTTFDVRSEVVLPSQPAALGTSHQTCIHNI